MQATISSIPPPPITATPHLWGFPADVWLGIATIVAVIVGPIAALWIQGIRDRRREERGRKLDIFRRLLTTRASPLSGVQIDALNLIECEYSPLEPKDKKVLDKWREYWDHLNKPQGDTPHDRAIWSQGRSDLMVELLWEMSEHLKMGMERSALKHLSYYPNFLAVMEAEQATLRQSAIEVFQGKKSLNVQLVGEAAPTAPPPTNPVNNE